MTSLRLLITAGPTREPIDAVRFIGNRSSGRMGLSLAAAAAANHSVTLLMGPICPFDPPAGVDVIRFETVAELQALMHTHWPAHDVLIMAAAVADYRPTASSAGKMERGEVAFTLKLQPTPDLVAEAVQSKRDDQRVVAFSLEEPAHLQDRAAAKMKRKGVDAIVANPLETMNALDISAVWMTATGQSDMLDKADKSAIAKALMSRIASLY